MREFEPMLEQAAPLPVEEVLAVQALAMSLVRGRARHPVVTPETPRRHRFVLYQNSGERVGSGETDQFLSVSVGKKDFRHWSMRISFLELALTHERRYSNYREVYAFDWYSDQTCWGTKRTIENYSKITETYFNPDRQETIDIVQSEIAVATYPLEVSDCDVLSDRMLAVIHTMQQQSLKVA